MVTASDSRVSWVDYSKGICIVAIVCLLSTRYVQGLAGTEGWVQYWVDFAHPFRTPAFFVIAGLFLSRTIDKPWRSYLDKKVVHFGYFFALWTTLYFVAATFNGEFDDGWPLWLNYLYWYVQPFGQLWFIEMLPIYFVVTRLVRRFPWIVVLTIAALLQIWSPESELRQVERFCERYVYFYAGYVFAPAVFSLAEKAASARAKAVAGLVVWVGINEWFVHAGLAEKPVYSLVLALAGTGAVIVCASLLSGSRWMDWLRYIGEHSLIVFLAFYPFTVLAGRAISNLGMIENVGWQTILVTIISIGIPILLYWTVRRTPFRVIFERPRWISLEHKISPKTLARPKTSRRLTP